MPYDYTYSYYYDLGQDLAENLMLYLLLWLLAAGIGIFCYVFRSVGVYTVAQRRELKNPWMAWVPVLNLWTLGSISDQYHYVTRGEVKNKRKWLIGLQITRMLVDVAMLVAEVFLYVNLIANVMSGVPEDEMLATMLTGVVIVLILSLVGLGVSIALAVVRYITVYDLYKSSTPKFAVLFLVLGILLNVAEACFIFFNRHKDGGMPPRRVRAEGQPPQQPEAPVYQPQPPVYQPQPPVYQPETPVTAEAVEPVAPVAEPVIPEAVAEEPVQPENPGPASWESQ